MVSAAANPAARFSPQSRVAVLLPLPLAGAYDYRVGAEPVGAGEFVVVPLGKREVIGVVWGEGSGDVEIGRLRPIGRRLGCPPLPEVTRKFVDWVAAYTLAAPGAVLKMAMSVPDALEPARPLHACRLAAPAPALKLTEARRRVLE
ncbi:MAG TPA: primosomal protein N', partial [Magnetospirillum sp.]|nr:primosomal protein N' [Magnetospirillum sp.]